jgi:hypothetical protein
MTAFHRSSHGRRTGLAMIARFSNAASTFQVSFLSDFLKHFLKDFLKQFLKLFETF